MLLKGKVKTMSRVSFITVSMDKIKCLTTLLFLCHQMVSETAWWLRHLFVFTFLFVGVPPMVRPEEDVACETLPSEIHIIKGQFSAENKYIMSSIPKNFHN
jgi:hypothetical protein